MASGTFQVPDGVRTMSWGMGAGEAITFTVPNTCRGFLVTSGTANAVRGELYFFAATSTEIWGTESLSASGINVTHVGNKLTVSNTSAYNVSIGIFILSSASNMISPDP